MSAAAGIRYESFIFKVDSIQYATERRCFDCLVWSLTEDGIHGGAPRKYCQTGAPLQP